MTQATHTTRDLIARWNAAVAAFQRKPTPNGHAQFAADIAEILGDLILLVEKHQNTPFTKAHDKAGT